MREDLTGRKFGRWTVINYAGSRKWHCICECGAHRMVWSSALKSQRSRGCHRCGKKKNNLIGRKFGHWTVIDYAGLSKHRNSTWHCICECGNRSVVAASQLKGKRSLGCRSCGQKLTVEDYEQAAVWRGECLVSSWPAARKVYQLRHGVKLPRHIHVCHTCDNPCCINDTHHFLGTHTDNMRDMYAKGRAHNLYTKGHPYYPRKIPVTHCPNGHEYLGNEYRPPSHPNQRYCLTCRKERDKKRESGWARQRKKQREAKERKAK